MDLVKSEFTKEVSVQYQGMLGEISEFYPVIQKATNNFYKTQSQFMDNMMTVHQPTVIRSLRQILAEVNSSKQALNEAYYKSKKTKVELERKKTLLEKIEDPFRQTVLLMN